FVQGSDVDAQSVMVRDVEPRAVDGLAGWGVGFQLDTDTGERADGILRHARVERTAEAGIVALGADLTVEDAAVRDGQQRPAGTLGRGIVAQHAFEFADDSPLEAATTLVVRWSTVEQVYEAGVSVGGAGATIEHVLVRDTRSSSTGQFGDGVVGTLVTPSPERVIEPDVRVRNSVLERNARAAIATFGGAMVLDGVWLDCNPIELNGEVIQLPQAGAPIDFSFEAQGDNRCGCGLEVYPCRVLSSGLFPPPQL
ncbi:MAG: hypothetical protein JRI23_11725, partial [Deltaproteobacteria bacterium]|nr:hypothetical protein [Deltaproteobacteria bacterium]MBW2532368.1 hypothetical protein [Deltaproteobacteria bacterium]